MLVLTFHIIRAGRAERGFAGKYGRENVIRERLCVSLSHNWPLTRYLYKTAGTLSRRAFINADLLLYRLIIKSVPSQRVTPSSSFKNFISLPFARKHSLALFFPFFFFSLSSLLRNNKGSRFFSTLSMAIVIVPWKEGNDGCRNFPKAHSLSRFLSNFHDTTVSLDKLWGTARTACAPHSGMCVCVCVR